MNYEQINSFPATSLADDKTSASHETASQRVTRIYASRGGPLVGWFFDECRRRGEDHRELASHLGVTTGYLNQLRLGVRLTANISDEFAYSCASYLGVPPVVVKIVAGRIPMSDFVQPSEPLDVALDRAVAQMLDDPVARHILPTDVGQLSIDAKQALVAMYAETSGRDVLGVRQIPEMVRWLQRGAMIHDESEAEAVRGHRDVVREE